MLVGLLTVSGCSHDDSVDRAKCVALRDHLIDLRVSSVATTGEDAISTTEIAAHRAAMKQALGDDFLARCEQRLDRHAIACNLAATDLDAASRCGSAQPK